MNYNNKTPIKITVEGGYFPDSSIQITLDPESTISDWITVFKTILTHQTFAEDSVKELFEESYDRYTNECTCRHDNYTDDTFTSATCSFSQDEKHSIKSGDIYLDSHRIMHY